MTDKIVIGKIMKARGLDGSFAVLPLTDNLERFNLLETVSLDEDQGNKSLARTGAAEHLHKEVQIDKVTIAGNKLFLKLVGVSSREAAEALRGLLLTIDKDQAVKLPEDRWFISDLLGCQVFDTVQGDLGSVTDVLSNGPQDSLQISQAGQADLYFPLIKKCLIKVDIANKKIEVALPDGLYEIYR